MISPARTFFCIVVIYTVLIAHTTYGQKYSSKYDNLDIDAILSNPRLRSQYVHCVLNIAPCSTGPSRFLKSIFAEAFVTKCKKCTEKQVDILDKITEWFTTNDPVTWNRAVLIALEEVRQKNA